MKLFGTYDVRYTQCSAIFRTRVHKVIFALFLVLLFFLPMLTGSQIHLTHQSNCRDFYQYDWPHDSRWLCWPDLFRAIRFYGGWSLHLWITGHPCRISLFVSSALCRFSSRFSRIDIRYSLPSIEGVLFSHGYVGCFFYHSMAHHLG